MDLQASQDRGLRGLIIVAALCALIAMAGCSPSRQVMVMVTPPASGGDDAVAIKVTGLPANASTDIDITSTDAAGETWSSQASFIADADGIVDVSNAASTGGSYLGVSAMGLITAMRTADAAAARTWPTGRPTRGHRPSRSLHTPAECSRRPPSPEPSSRIR